MRENKKFHRDNILIRLRTVVTFPLLLILVSLSAEAADVTELITPLAPIQQTNPTYNPGWHNVVAEPVSSEEARTLLGELVFNESSSLATSFELASAYATPSDYTQLAEALENDPRRIYQFIRNNFEYVPYYGALKGPYLTLHERSGNDFDQAALLVKLLRAAGYVANFRYGSVSVLLSDPGAIQALSDWLGTDAEDQLIIQTFADGGIPRTFSNNLIEFDHVWVEAVIDSEIVALDPSYKLSQRDHSIDIAAGMGLSLTNLLNAAGGTVTADFIQAMDEPGLDAYLTSLTSQLKAHFEQNYPNASVKEIVGGFTIIPDNSDSLPTSLPLTASALFSAWSEIPSNYIHTVRLEHGGIDTTYDIPDVAGRKISIQYVGEGAVDPAPDDAANFGSVAIGEEGGSFAWQPTNPNSVAIQLTSTISGSGSSAFHFQDGAGIQTIPAGGNATVQVQFSGVGQSSGRKNAVLNFEYSYEGSIIGSSDVVLTGAVEPGRVAEIYIDDVLSVSEGVPTGNLSSLVVSVDHPYASTNGTFADQSVEFTLNRNGNYVLVSAFGGDHNSTLLPERQRLLSRMSVEGVAPDSPEMLSETLNVIGQTWMQQTQLNDDIVSSLSNVRTIYHHRFGIAAQEEGYFVDIKAQLTTSPSRSLITQRGAFQASSFITSAMEHSVLEQLQGEDNPGISTIKIIALNNQYGDKLFRADSANYSSIQSQLNGYSSFHLNLFQGLIDTGHTLILPESGLVTLNDWQGVGYVDYLVSSPTRRGLGMIIGGGLHGGFSSMPEQIDPSYTEDEAFVESLPPANTPTPMAADPVDLGSGAFLSNLGDLSLGGSGSRGLSFSRSYNSQQVSQNTSHMGNGWNHSYNIYIAEHSDVSGALGEKTIFEALPHLVANQVLLQLMDPEHPSIEHWGVGAMVADWATNQLLNKSRTIHMGGQAVTYRELPDGTFTRPAGSTADFVKSGSTFELRERFGRVFTFNGDDRVSSITDVDGNAISFSYSGDYLTQVTDALGRTLTLSYSGDDLSSVIDSTGRSVTFDYTNGNLISSTGLESAQWQYNYDSLNRMISIIDPLNTVMVSNTYDDFDRVTHQVAPRENATALYKMHYTGLSSSEETPDGARTTYYYDFNKRTVGVENALGHRTHTAYDGQNHGVSFIDTLGREVSMTYDDSHNLLASENPLGQVSTFTYDSQNRMIAATDALSHTTETDFDLEHHTIASRDALGHQSNMTYRFDGLLETVTDPRNVLTTYSYDSYGFPAEAQTGSQPTVTTQYDSVGRLLSLTDQAGALTTYTHDDRGLVLTRTDPLNKTATMSYNALGQLVTQVDRNAEAYTATYTPSQKLDVVTFPSRASTANHPFVPGFSVDFDYDADRDRVVSMTDPMGVTTNSYDLLDRLISHTDPHGFQVQYRYDQGNNLTQLTYPDGKTLSYTYDTLDRIAGITIDWLDKTVTPSYDQASRLTRLDNFNDTYSTFIYDDADRLTRLSHFKSDDKIIGQYEFTLDANGNRIQAKITNETIRPSGLIDQVRNLSYNDEKNRLLTADTHELVSFIYDDEGQTQRVVGDTTNTHYEFDGAHRLVAYNSASDSASYQYDGAGNRLAATRNGVTTRYIYNANGQLIAEADGSNTITRYYIYGLGLMAFFDVATNQLYTYHHDATGHTVAMTDDTQAIVNRYSYSPYGRVLAKDEQIKQPFTYAGQAGIYTEADDLYYMRARYYDAKIQRFINEDPSGFAGGLNLYAYAGGNPIYFIDPSGLGPEAGGLGSTVLSVLGVFPGVDLMVAIVDPKATILDVALGAVAVVPGVGKGISTLGKAARWFAKATKPANLSPPGAGRSGAFREAKRQSGIPVSQQPSRVTQNIDKRGNTQPGKTYEFDVTGEGGKRRTVNVRDDAGGHNYGNGNSQNRGSHFNDDAGNHFDY